MLGLIVFLSFFLFFFSITLVVPFFPPGQLICSLLGNSETTYPVAGLSGDGIIAGTVNGLIWAVIIMIFYCYSRGPHKGRVFLPVWLPGYATSHASTVNRGPSKSCAGGSSEVEEDESLPIEAIEGIGYMYGHVLRDLDVTSVHDLLVVGATKTGREYLAKKLDVSPATVAKWVITAKTLFSTCSLFGS